MSEKDAEERGRVWGIEECMKVFAERVSSKSIDPEIAQLVNENFRSLLAPARFEKEKEDAKA